MWEEILDMAREWEIIYYETSRGESPVYTFIESLDIKTKSKIAYAINLLEKLGPNVRPPHVKKLEGLNLWEIRVLGKENARIFYVARTSNSFLLLHGFLKKKQKTDKREIQTALQRLAEFKKK